MADDRLWLYSRWKQVSPISEGEVELSDKRNSSFGSGVRAFRSRLRYQRGANQFHIVTGEDTAIRISRRAPRALSIPKRRGGIQHMRAADLSVDHPRVIDNYRIAHEIAVRDSRGEASTEDLRRAMVAYRALFEDLLEEHVLDHQEVRR